MTFLYILSGCFILVLIAKLIWKSIKLVFNIMLILLGLGILGTLLSMLL